MAKRLCKLRRHDIAESFGEITRLVSQPQFLCGSCARSSVEKSSLCKPLAISHEKTAKVDLNLQQDKTVLSKSVLKKAQKEAKKQKKYQKKLEKVLKKQKKMVKKYQKIEKEFAGINLSLLSFNDSPENQAIH